MVVGDGGEPQRKREDRSHRNQSEEEWKEAEGRDSCTRALSGQCVVGVGLAEKLGCVDRGLLNATMRRVPIGREWRPPDADEKPPAKKNKETTKPTNSQGQPNQGKRERGGEKEKGVGDKRAEASPLPP